MCVLLYTFYKEKSWNKRCLAYAISLLTRFFLLLAVVLLHALTSSWIFIINNNNNVIIILYLLDVHYMKTTQATVLGKPSKVRCLYIEIHRNNKKVLPSWKLKYNDYSVSLLINTISEYNYCNKYTNVNYLRKEI